MAALDEAEAYTQWLSTGLGVFCASTLDRGEGSSVRVGSPEVLAQRG